MSNHENCMHSMEFDSMEACSKCTNAQYKRLVREARIQSLILGSVTVATIARYDDT